MDPNPIQWCPYKKRKFGDMYTLGESNVNVRTEIGVTSTSQGTLETASRAPETGERPGAGSPSRLSEGTNPVINLDLRCLAITL